MSLQLMGPVSFSESQHHTRWMLLHFGLGKQEEDKWSSEVGDPKVVLRRKEGGNKTGRKVEEKREKEKKRYMLRQSWTVGRFSCNVKENLRKPELESEQRGDTYMTFAKFLGVLDPLPRCHVQKSGDFVPFVCFLGTPLPHLVWTSYKWGVLLSGKKSFFSPRQIFAIRRRHLKV